jgi:hypothetical protein
MNATMPLFDDDEALTEGEACALAAAVSERVMAHLSRAVGFRCAHADGRKTLCLRQRGAAVMIALWGRGAWGCIGCGVDVRSLAKEACAIHGEAGERARAVEVC